MYGQDLFHWTDNAGNRHTFETLNQSKCNIKAPSIQIDRGIIKDKSLLPIKGFSYGQTVLGGEKAKVKIGHLSCKNPSPKVPLTHQLSSVIQQIGNLEVRIDTLTGKMTLEKQEMENLNLRNDPSTNQMSSVIQEIDILTEKMTLEKRKMENLHLRIDPLTNQMNLVKKITGILDVRNDPLSLVIQEIENLEVKFEKIRNAEVRIEKVRNMSLECSNTYKIEKLTDDISIPCNDTSKSDYKWLDGTCYYFETKKLLNFEDALQNCKDKFGPNRNGGILFEPKSKENIDKVILFAIDTFGFSYYSKFWFGLYKQEGIWRFKRTGSFPSFVLHIFTSVATDECIHQDMFHRSIQDDCTHPHNSICEML